MPEGIFQYVLVGWLAIALLIAAATDLKGRKIYNWLNMAIAVTAPLFWWASGMALWPDIAIQIGFAVAVFAVLLGLYALKTMGGGDVKLLAALALWIAPMPFLQLVIVMALAGGLLTILLGIWHVTRRNKGKLVIPYGVAIAFGGLWVLHVEHMTAIKSVTGLG